MCGRDSLTQTECVDQMRFACLIAQFERDGWPLAIVQRLHSAPELTLREVVFMSVDTRSSHGTTV